MNKPSDSWESQDTAQLENELRRIWQSAANTRKATAPRRVTAILEQSQAELSLRDSFNFFIYLGEACAVLAATIVHLPFTSEHPSQAQDAKK